MGLATALGIGALLIAGGSSAKQIHDEEKRADEEKERAKELKQEEENKAAAAKAKANIAQDTALELGADTDELELLRGRAQKQRLSVGRTGVGGLSRGVGTGLRIG